MNGYIKVYTTKSRMLEFLEGKSVLVKLNWDEEYEYDFFVSLKDLVPLHKVDWEIANNKQCAIVEVLDFI